MRTTKIIAFSVPPAFEMAIQQHAKAEHRTMSEYIREAVRQYMAVQKFEATRMNVREKMKKRGLKATDVASEVEKLRKRS